MTEGAQRKSTNVCKDNVGRDVRRAGQHRGKVKNVEWLAFVSNIPTQSEIATDNDY